jgi:hypothetical protein
LEETVTGVAITAPYMRLNLVGAVLSLANPPWQREVWGRPDVPKPGHYEDLDMVVHCLFDDFCDADDPVPYLGVTLRNEDELRLMQELGAQFNLLFKELGGHAQVDAYLDSPRWSRVVAVAGRLAQEMVGNDLLELAKLTDPGQRDQQASTPGKEP